MMKPEKRESSEKVTVVEAGLYTNFRTGQILAQRMLICDSVGLKLERDDLRLDSSDGNLKAKERRFQA